MHFGALEAGVCAVVLLTDLRHRHTMIQVDGSNHERLTRGRELRREISSDDIADWDNVPESTEQFVLICEDTDIRRAHPWTIWMLYEIPAATRSLPEGLPTTKELDFPPGVLQGKNSWPHGQRTGYRGPMPLQGTGVHHYRFRLFALDVKFDFEPDLEKRTILSAMKGHVLAEAELVGTFKK